MREFVSAAKEADAEVIEPIKFKLDGTEYSAYPPTESQIALVVAATTGGYKNENEQIAALINFAVALLSKEDHDAIVQKLMDRDDPFELSSDDPEKASLMGIMEHIIEEATGNPTKLSSASTPSREKTGKKSTATVQPKALTRSA